MRSMRCFVGPMCTVTVQTTVGANHSSQLNQSYMNPNFGPDAIYPSQTHLLDALDRRILHVGLDAPTHFTNTQYNSTSRVYDYR